MSESYHDARCASIDGVFEGPERNDLDVYAAMVMVEEFGATSVVDIGCGTGTLAAMVADQGLEMIGVDPSALALDVARTKAGADRVR